MADSDLMSQFYSTDFYRGQAEGSLRSAHIILRLIFDCIKPARLLDVGCGAGAWLLAAKRMGVNDVHGIDGPWVRSVIDNNSGIKLYIQDLDSLREIDGNYELCISLEVAEHIPETHADQFVKALCSASSIVLFGAAIELQGGQNHINEQKQSYWIRKFEDNGYKCLDYIRPIVWDFDEVECWYRQNIFLFAHDSVDRSIFEPLRLHCKPLYDIVHPEVLRVKVERFNSLVHDPSFRDVLRIAMNYLARKFD